MLRKAVQAERQAVAGAERCHLKVNAVCRHANNLDVSPIHMGLMRLFDRVVGAANMLYPAQHQSGIL